MQITQLSLIGMELFPGCNEPEYVYLDSTGRYLHLPSGQVFTEEALDFFANTEREYQSTKEDLTFYQLIELFGSECYEAVKKGIEAKIKAIKKEDSNESKQRALLYKNVINKITAYKQQQLVREFIETNLKERTGERMNEKKKLEYLLSFIRKLQQEGGKEGKNVASTASRITEEDIERAKHVPIETVFPTKLRKMGNRGIGLCPLHGEKTSSFTVYLKENTWHCFGCHEGRDVVDLVMKLEGLDFLQAVKKLLKK
jgi:hypothetical protein